MNLYLLKGFSSIYNCPLGMKCVGRNTELLNRRKDVRYARKNPFERIAGQ